MKNNKKESIDNAKSKSNKDDLIFVGGSPYISNR